MSEADVLSEVMHACPNEVLMCIFSYLKPKDIVKCRLVCSQWKLIVDRLFENESLWREHCKNEYSEIYKSAYYKSNCKAELSWYKLYRSLSLWTRIKQAAVTLVEFASVPSERDEVRGFQILKQGVLGVHTQRGIIYYNIATLKRSNRATVPGDYQRYVENDDYILLVKPNLDLYIERKATESCSYQPRESYPAVRHFLLKRDHCYYVSVRNELYTCHLGKEQFKSNLVAVVPDRVTCLGYEAGYLYMVTFQRHIYKLVGSELVLLCTLDNSPVMFYKMRRYNFLDHLDWRIYFEWMYVQKHAVTRRSISNIMVAKVYGSVVMVGSNHGVFEIYDTTKTDDEIEVFSKKPIKQFNFAEPEDCLALLNCAIIKIDVIETEDTHAVLVCMLSKIAVLEFSHTSRNPRSVFTYEDLQDLKTIKMVERMTL